VTNLRRSLCRLRTSRDPAYGPGDNIRRCVGSRERALYAVGLFILLYVCACGAPRSTCQDLNAACSSAIAQNIGHITHSQVQCQYVSHGRPVESSRYLECGDPKRIYAGVNLVVVGLNGNWSSQTLRLPGKVYRIVFLSGCVRGGMC
jgi:hypothetical protein